MDPYTPRTRHVGRKKSLALSTKEYTKVAGTIASARRSRNLECGIDDERNGRGRHDFSSKDPSFIAETSFVKAPLNSRVPSHSHMMPRTHGKGKSREESLDSVSLDIQEALILEDLLFVLMGIEGTHIVFHPDYSIEDDDPIRGIKFAISSALDPSLSDLVERVLPLATYYTGITSFIEQRSHLEYGLVNHALCASIRDMLKPSRTTKRCCHNWNMPSTPPLDFLSRNCGFTCTRPSIPSLSYTNSRRNLRLTIASEIRPVYLLTLALTMHGTKPLALGERS